MNLLKYPSFSEIIVEVDLDITVCHGATQVTPSPVDFYPVWSMFSGPVLLSLYPTNICTNCSSRSLD